MVDTKVKELLSSGVNELNVAITDRQIDNLLKFVNLLLKWNKTYSLTAIVDLEQVINYHILDGITVVEYLNNSAINFNSLLDVGSGMGVPGVILAICYPDKLISVLDSNSKKSSFLRQVGIELGLSNLTVLHKRVEEYTIQNKYDIIISRAFADISLFVKLSKHLLKNNTGFFIAMKSKKVLEEAKLMEGYNIEFYETKIPRLQDKRFLVKISHG